MMTHGKLSEDGSLKDFAGFEVDSSYKELSSFETYLVEDVVTYYSHYNQDGTANHDAMNAIKLEADHEEWKALRAIAVSKIVVEVDGMLFDGDVESQNTMVRAVQSLVGDETIQWILADNTTATVTQTELGKALRLAGQAQSELWHKEGI